MIGDAARGTAKWVSRYLGRMLWVGALPLLACAAGVAVFVAFHPIEGSRAPGAEAVTLIAAAFFTGLVSFIAPVSALAPVWACAVVGVLVQGFLVNREYREIANLVLVFVGTAYCAWLGNVFLGTLCGMAILAAWTVWHWNGVRGRLIEVAAAVGIGCCLALAGVLAMATVG